MFQRFVLSNIEFAILRPRGAFRTATSGSTWTFFKKENEKVKNINTQMKKRKKRKHADPQNNARGRSSIFGTTASSKKRQSAKMHPTDHTSTCPVFVFWKIQKCFQ